MHVWVYFEPTSQVYAQFLEFEKQICKLFCPILGFVNGITTEKSVCGGYITHNGPIKKYTWINIDLNNICTTVSTVIEIFLYFLYFVLHIQHGHPFFLIVSSSIGEKLNSFFTYPSESRFERKLNNSFTYPSESGFERKLSNFFTYLLVSGFGGMCFINIDI